VTLPSTAGPSQNQPDSSHLAYVIEDHALDPVPAAERKSGLALSWMTVGIITTLAQLLIGGIVTAIAGVPLGLAAGGVTAVYGALLGWFVARIAHREGTSGTVTSRRYGFGIRGSALGSAIVAFTLITFLALENALLYNGIRFAFSLSDTWPLRIAVYGTLTVAWVLLSLFGVNLAIRISSALTVVFILLLGYLVFRAGWQSPTPIATTLGHGALIPGTAVDRFQSALVLLAGPVGALSLVAGDYARYARTRRDVAILATAGAVVVDVVIVFAGTILVFGGEALAVRYLIGHGLATAQTAPGHAAALSQSNTGAYFIILSTIAGFFLMLVAQAKAQVLNTYSSSLALTTLSDGLGRWRPGRSVMVILANLVSLAMIAGGVLTQLQDWIGDLGILTTSCAAVMIADYYLVQRGTRTARTGVEDINWAGVVTVSAASVTAIALETLGVFRMGFVLALVMVLAVYPVLRLWILRPGTLTYWHGEEQRELIDLETSFDL
jgi:cytosine permease